MPGKQPAAYLLSCWLPPAVAYIAMITADTDSTFSSIFVLVSIVFSAAMFIYGWRLLIKGRGNRIALFCAAGIAGAPALIVALLLLVFAINPSNVHL